jgi:DNA-binding MarR family transcriptional regulator
MEAMSSLQHEIKQTRPFRSLEEEAYIAIRLTSQIVDQPWIRYLRRTEGISPSQYNLLRILRGAGPEGRTMSEISDRMINRDPDATRLADRMIKRGLVRRLRDTDDRRVVRLFITDQGLAMLARLDEAVNVFLERALAGLGPRDMKTLIALLGRIRSGLQPFPSPEQDA